MNIYARPQFRRHGVGDAVVRWLIGQAEQRGISKIYLETSEDGRPLYQEIWFRDMRGYMKFTMEAITLQDILKRHHQKSNDLRLEQKTELSQRRNTMP